MIALVNVDNTTDLIKPLSTATPTALANKVDKVSGLRLINTAEITKLGNQSSTTIGDQTLPTMSSLGAVSSNVEITCVTHTQITHDAKGLFTAGIAAATKKNYVSDTELAELNQIRQLQSYSNVTDADSNSYKTVKIGNQSWMAEYLKITRYKLGNTNISQNLPANYLIFNTTIACRL